MCTVITKRILIELLSLSPSMCFLMQSEFINLLVREMERGKKTCHKLHNDGHKQARFH